MHYLTKLFTLVELMRSQPQYGYVTGGVQKHELSDLAQHHYLVAFVAWQLGLYVNARGANLNLGRIIEYALVHDFGELLGGDIAMPYAMVNKKARKAAKVFEVENQKFLAKFFGEHRKYFLQLTEEIMGIQKPSDEAAIVKLADYIEHTQYKMYVRKLIPRDFVLAEEKTASYFRKMKNIIARKALQEFIALWLKELKNGKTAADIIAGEE